MFDGCIVILLARVLALESRLEELAEALSPALRAMIGSDWKAGYELFIVNSPDVDAGTREKFRVCLEEYTVLHQILQSSADSPAAIRDAITNHNTFRQIVERERSKRITALLENKILDAHFLPVLHPTESLNQGPGYVILFRQILSIPGNLVEALLQGLPSLDVLPTKIQTNAGQVLACPSGVVANVISPHVEHILQRFSNVFGRVGVADCSKPYREWLVRTTCEGIGE